MSMIDFIKKHENVLSTDRDNYRRKFASLKKRLEELQSLQPDYQSIADRIYDKLGKENLSVIDAEDEIKVEDEVIGIGQYGYRKVQGLKGRVVEIVSGIVRSGGRALYSVEWEKRIEGGYSFKGKAKDGYGWPVQKENLRKVSVKPKITSRKDYDHFLKRIPDSEEYLDYDDKDFKRGDVIELTTDLMAFGVFEKAKGERGIINRQNNDLSDCDVYLNDCYYNVSPNEMAKVKKREFTVGDIVEIKEDKVEDCGVKGWGRVKEMESLNALIAYEEFQFINDEIKDEYDYREGEPLEAWAFEGEFRHKDRSNLIETIEEEFNLSEYEEKRLDLVNEISEFVQKEKISYEELLKYFAGDVIAELELNYDEELEDLLK